MTNRSAIIVPPPQPATTAVTNDIRDIRPPVPLPNPWPYICLAAAVLWLIAAALGLWLYWRKRKVQRPLVPAVPAHIRARHKLTGALALLQDPRLFCILVSDTLRQYLEERFEFRAPERTTEEFLLELQSTTILNVDQKQRLSEFLERCDLVKFAKLEPTETELRELLNAALRLIDETSQDLRLSAAPGGPASTPPPLPAERTEVASAASSPPNR